MRKILLSAASLALIAGPALANPVQINHGGNPTQSQVYGDGSSANSNRNVNTNLNFNRSTSHSNSFSGASATGGNARATGGSSAAYGGAGGKGGHGGSATVNVYSGAGDPSNPGGGASNSANDPAGDPSGDPSGGNSGGYGGGGHGGPQIPVASAVAPSVMSFNPCSGSSASGAAQFAPFGFSFGTGGGFDNACRLHMLGQDQAAVAYLCRANGDIRQAFKDIGQPCPEDRPAVVAAAVPVPPNERFKFDYCFTASAGELKQHEECRAVRQN